jgi:uncharacterized membrane protein
MVAEILFALLCCILPAVVMWLCERVKLIRRVGPVMICYIIGIVIGNSGLLPDIVEGEFSLRKTLSEIAVPLAIPMMLFSCNFKKFSIKTSLVATVVGIVSVLITVVAGFYIFAPHLGDEAPAIAGCLVGTFTGGTPNLVALYKMLGLSEDTFLVMTTFDIAICFFYLIFLMGVGIKVARLWLGRGKSDDEEFTAEDTSINPYRAFLNKRAFVQLLKIVGATIAVVGVSFGVATFVQQYDESLFMLVLFLTLTTLSLALTAWNEVKQWDKSYDAGMYLVYIFSLAIASCADLSTIDFEKGFYLFLLQLFGVFVSLILTLVLGKICRIDGDTAIITSNTMINSPALVPMVAASMKNRDIVVVGISIGLVGYAVGNYLGYFVFELLGGKF